jgi:diguanylate cyclase (GGDEF)-like protein
VFDADTGLLDERVFVVSLERKVAAARRHLRPLTLVLVDVTSGLPADGREQRHALTGFGAVVRETMRDSDIACRIGTSNFALILEDTPEAGGVWAAERLQIAMACANTPLTRMVASVATYPNHGLQADEVLLRGRAALIRARNSDSEGLGPVEVAKSD